MFINNVTPDNGLSAPSNSWFTFFGQFFDHGLDMIDKGGNDSVFIPLTPDDPLYVKGGHANFMVLSRATDLPGPDGVLGTADDVHQFTNQTSPFVDQSQTYASDPSHQVFLRDYMIGVDGHLHSSGALLGQAKADGKDGMANWGELKAQAATQVRHPAHRRRRRQRAAAGDRRLRQLHPRPARAAAGRRPQRRRHHQLGRGQPRQPRQPAPVGARRPTRCCSPATPSSTTWRTARRRPMISGGP